MALFDPDKIFRSLVSAMGITPEQVVSLVTEIVTEVRTIRLEREAFKAASARVVADYNARLDRIEATINSIANELAMARPRTAAPFREMETDEHGRHGTEHVNGG